MPINKELFDLGILDNRTVNNFDSIITFLKKNKDKAYNCQELSWELKIPYSAINILLKRARTKELLECKSFGRIRYYRVN